MKTKHYLIALVALLAVSCIGAGNSNQTSTSEAQQQTKAEIKTYSLEELLEVASTLVDEKVTIKANVTHTCKHSGRRCFVTGDNPNVSFRVEAAGSRLGGFNRELVGSELAITGILREKRLTQEYIDQWEEQVKEKEGKEDGSAESCGAETANIQSIRKWMKDNGKDYYATYYMDGESYEVIE